MSYLIVDNFAGGGGASLGIEQGLGRPVDIAINHDATAIALHRVNHPHTRHYCEDVFDVDPVRATGGRPVLLAWFSPDCKHHSKARGGRPVEKKIRSLAWVVLRWASRLKARKPRVIILENVEEFQDWGPLIPKRVDGRIVRDAAGAPVLVPDPRRRAKTFRQWCDNLRALGYRVEHRELRACDYGAPTIRKRLFVVARCDGHPIVWPEPTHGPGLEPYRTAAECIDWSLPCPSIFERKRPLAENTLRRIARGIQRYVIEDPEPFIVRIGQTGGNGDYCNSTDEPLTTVVTKAEHCLVVPVVSRYYGRSTGGRVDQPAGTETANDKTALVAAFLSTFNHGGGKPHAPKSPGEPFRTVTATRDAHALCTSHLLKLKGTCRDGQRVDAPAPTVQAGGNHLGEVRAFLIKYYSGGTGKTGWPLTRPAPTVTEKHRLGLVTVHGAEYQIVDIGMRMLQPAELFAAQDFPPDYIIDRLADGTRLTKTAQVKLCGNAVPPAFARALVRDNVAAFYVDQLRGEANDAQ